VFDLVLLRSFAAVAETLSFTAAAAELRMSQSTVSKHVRALEAAAGAILFERDTREVLLTDAGDTMALFARRILEAHDDATAYFGRSSTVPRLRIGTIPLVALSVLPVIVSEFRDAHPDVVVDLRVDPEADAELAAAVRAGDLDLALVTPHVAPSTRTLIRQRYVWVGAPGLELRREDPVPIILLQGLTPSRMGMFRELEESGCTWRTSCFARDWHGVYAALRAGLGVIILPHGMIPPDLVPIEADWLPQLSEGEFALIENPAAPREWVRDFRAITRRLLQV
jgi:DNA-binding transcriptional LysR family regulator